MKIFQQYITTQLLEGSVLLCKYQMAKTGLFCIDQRQPSNTNPLEIESHIWQLLKLPWFDMAASCRNQVLCMGHSQGLNSGTFSPDTSGQWNFCPSFSLPRESEAPTLCFHRSCIWPNNCLAAISPYCFMHSIYSFIAFKIVTKKKWKRTQK